MMDKGTRKILIAASLLILAAVIFWPDDQDSSVDVSTDQQSTPEPTPVPTPDPAKGAVAVALNKEDAGAVVDMQRLAQKARSTLISVDSVRALPPEKMHQPRSFLAESAQALGEMREFWEAHPSTRTMALEFYRECASDPRLITSLQALCLSDAQELAADLGQDPNGIEAPKEARVLVAQMHRALGETSL